MSSKEEKDFKNASLLAGVPINVVFCIIALAFSVFGLKLFFSVYHYSEIVSSGLTQEQVIDEVAFMVSVTMALLFPTIITISWWLGTILDLTILKTDIRYWLSVRLTWKLQRMLVRQIGGDYGAQGRIARLSNVKRLKSFIWTRVASEKVTIAVKLSGRADIDSLIKREDLNEVADDVAQELGKTYTSWQKVLIHKKFLFFTWTEKYLVSQLG